MTIGIKLILFKSAKPQKKNYHIVEIISIRSNEKILVNELSAFCTNFVEGNTILHFYRH